MINKKVLMSSADFFSNDQPINPYYHKEAVDVELAIHEHEQVAASLKLAGVDVVRVDAPPTSQDGIYTANWALVRGDNAVLARLPNARKSEEMWAKNTLEGLGLKVHLVPDGMKFSGQGDALACGGDLFCGSTYRSDVGAQKFAADTLGYRQIQLRTIPQLDENGLEQINKSSGWPDSFYYDIDLALSIIKGPSAGSMGTIAYCPEAFTPESREMLEHLDGYDKIIVSEHEAREGFACNLVSTGTSVVMSANAPQLKAELENRGMTVYTPEITEIAKGGGYIRCTSLSLV